DAVGGARGRAERAADAFFEPVLVAVEKMAAPEARVDGPLVLRVLLGDRLPGDLAGGDREALQALDGVWDQVATAPSGGTNAFTVATGRSTFQPNRISWS